MKVLLAPLVFRRRLCKHCARIWHQKHPGSWLPLFEFESLPPLGSFDANRGFRPDFPTLLMFEEFVIDGEAFEQLKRPGNRIWLSEWSELIDVLDSEGAITLADVRAAGHKRSHKRGWMLRRDLGDPNRWWPAMAYYNALTTRAVELLGDNPREAQNLSWQFDPEAGLGIRGDDGALHNLAVVLAEAGESDFEAHRTLFPSVLNILKDQLQEVNACIIACDELAVAPVMWAPYRRYLEEKLRPQPNPNATTIEAAGRQFFEITFPAYAPTTVHAFAKLRSDKRINALRAEILGAAMRGDLLDPRYPQRVLTEVLSLEQNAAKMRRISAWIATAVGTIPVSGLGLAAAAVADGIAKRLERKRREQWHWFYLISDGRGAT